MAGDMDELMDQIEQEAQAEGPEGVAELRALQRKYRAANRQGGRLMTYEDRLRGLSEHAEPEPWQTRLFHGPERKPDPDGAYLKGYQVVKVAEDEMSYKRLATTTPTEDRWLPGSKANVDLMTFQRNSAEKVAAVVTLIREVVESAPPSWHPRLAAALAALDEEALA